MVTSQVAMHHAFDMPQLCPESSNFVVQVEIFGMRAVKPESLKVCSSRCRGVAPRNSKAVLRDIAKVSQAGVHNHLDLKFRFWS